MEVNDKNKQKEERNNYMNLIIQSSCPKKIIVAGPGTGKTFLFKELLRTKNNNSIALTFINNLAHQLEKDLEGLAQAYTFHGYCKKLLHRIAAGGIKTNFIFFPHLDIIIESDANIFSFNGNDFRYAFQNMIEDDGRIDFYLSRGNFYNAVSYDDSVYRVLKYFDINPAEIPTFEQIVVDEYQDFNKLEVEFINNLETKSPILIVGDDDQAIYDFKNASASFIREKIKASAFIFFELPFSSRCTQVIVNAVNEIVAKAQKIGRLQQRIPKKFICYAPDKQEDSRLFPYIEHIQCSVHQKNAPYISKFIGQEILNIPQEVVADLMQISKDTGEPDVLIIGPSHYLDLIYEHLKTNFKNLIYSKRGKDLSILDGYRILLNEDDSNLGWRILLEFSDIHEKEEIIKSANKETSLVSLLSDEFKGEHSERIEFLKSIKEGDDITAEKKVKAKKLFNMEYEALFKEISRSFEEDEKKTPAKNEIKVQLTTFNGCKGLSAAFVFVVGFNNGDFPRDPKNLTDNEICQFIVALTRTRKKCYLISNLRFGGKGIFKPSLFLGWINSSRIHSQEINKNYFNNLKQKA